MSAADWIVVACSAPNDPLRHRLADGTLLASLVDTAAPSAVILLDPAECFTCESSLSLWAAIRDRHPKHVIFVFTRPPNMQEGRRLAVMRFHAQGVLVGAGRGVARRQPWVIVVTNKSAAPLVVPLRNSDNLAASFRERLTRGIGAGTNAVR